MSVRRTLKTLAADLNDIMRAARARELSVVDADVQLAQLRVQVRLSAALSVCAGWSLTFRSSKP